MSVFSVVGLAYFTGFLKFFNVDQISTIRRVIFLIALPAAIFREIAMHSLTWETWMPFVNSVLTQITLHVLIAITLIVLPMDAKYVRFLQACFSTAYSSFFFNYPIIQILYGNDYLYIPILNSFVHHLILTPIHSLMILNPRKDHTNAHDSDHQEEEEGPEFPEDGMDNDSGAPIHPVVMPNHKEAESINVEHEQNISDAEEPKVVVHDSENPPKDDQDIDELEEDSIEEPPPPTAGKTLLWTLLTPMNICVLLGIIWSAAIQPRWEMPLFIHALVQNLEHAVPAAGLTCVGVFLWEHPFFGCNWVEVSIYIATHFIVKPLISIFWSWILKFPGEIARIVTLSNVAPAALTGYVMTLNCGYGMKSASFTFFWSNLVFIPVFFLWVVVFNETGLFSK